MLATKRTPIRKTGVDVQHLEVVGIQVRKVAVTCKWRSRGELR
jgi:hypothetical protein